MYAIRSISERIEFIKIGLTLYDLHLLEICIRAIVMWLNYLQTLGALALFILGIHLLHAGFKSMISFRTLRATLIKLTKNNFISFLSGFVSTAALQSSSVVSIITIGLSGSRLIHLKRAMFIMMGANVGTTLTSWLVILFGMKWDVLTIGLPLLILAVPLHLTNKKTQKWGMFLLGISFIFISLSILKESIPDSVLYDWVNQSHVVSLREELLYLLIGLVITAITQSSSVVISVMIILIGEAFPLELLLSLLIGVNIGTTMTAQVAAWFSTISARKVAVFHSSFNLIGACLFFSFISVIARVLSQLDFSKPYYYLAFFHSSFNLITVIFCTLIFRFVFVFIQRLFKNAKESNHEREFYNTSSIVNLFQIDLDIQKFTSITVQTIQALDAISNEADKEKCDRYIQKIVELESKSDKLEVSIREDLNQVIPLDFSASELNQFSQISDVIHYLENINDLALRLAYTQQERKLNHAYFLPDQHHCIDHIQLCINSLTKLVMQRFYSLSNTQDYKSELTIIENQLKEHHRNATDDLFKKIAKGKTQALSALYYKEIIDIYLRIGSYMVKISASLSS